MHAHLTVAKFVLLPARASCTSTGLALNAATVRPAPRSYKQAVRDCPSCPPEVRLGIAACCLKLGNTEKAELAYRRTLELSPNCTPALLGLAVLKLHVSSDEEVRCPGWMVVAWSSPHAWASAKEDGCSLIPLARLGVCQSRIGTEPCTFLC